MTEHVTHVEYRVVRPDGNLIWHEVRASPMDDGWRVLLAGDALVIELNMPEVMPPWRIERREGADAEWTLVAERTT